MVVAIEPTWRFFVVILPMLFRCGDAASAAEDAVVVATSVCIRCRMSACRRWSDSRMRDYDRSQQKIRGMIEELAVADASVMALAIGPRLPMRAASADEIARRRLDASARGGPSGEERRRIS